MINLKVFTAFSGYDSQCLALDRLKADWGGQFDYELIGWSEIEPNAIKAHNALYPQWQDCNFGDITKIEWQEVADFDLFTYSFPCTDISNAGKHAGFAEGSNTRSSLLWECEKAIKAKQPKYLLLENVKALVQKKYLPDFNRWLQILESYGYINYWQVMNARNYGVAQNRERVFVVSILGEHAPYIFPDTMKLSKRVEDYMEQGVDESYYIDPERITQRVLNDILEQPNVRAEMEKLYHEEWSQQ